MESASQRKAFQQYEANQWFIRNKRILEIFDGKRDPAASVIEQYTIKPKRILEIGSSAGYRLDYLKKINPSAQVVGIDPSTDAVKEGKLLYPGVELHVMTADEMSLFEDGYFDLVIVGFVFYVIDRPLLLKVVSEIDRVLADKGWLLNTDFFSEKPVRNKYHHITAFEAFSFKQRYEEIFISSGMYQLLHKTSFDHSSLIPDASDDYFNKCATSLLKKDVYTVYK